MGWIEHGDASYIEMKNRDIAALRDEVVMLRNVLRELYLLVKHNNPRLLTTGHDDRLCAALRDDEQAPS